MEYDLDEHGDAKYLSEMTYWLTSWREFPDLENILQILNVSVNKLDFS